MKAIDNAIAASTCQARSVVREFDEPNMNANLSKNLYFSKGEARPRLRRAFTQVTIQLSLPVPAVAPSFKQQIAPHDVKHACQEDKRN